MTQKWSETLTPMTEGMFEWLLPASSRAARLKARLAAEVDELVQRNVENLRWATLQNLDRAFRRFEGWFDDRLAEATVATRGAIDTALVQRREHADRARDELVRLRLASRPLSAARDELETAAPEGGK